MSARPRVVVEALAVRGQPTGVAGAALDLLRALAARDRGLDFLLVAADAAPFAFLADRPGWRVAAPAGLRSGAGRALFLQRGLPRLCAGEEAALLHALQPVAPCRPACAQVVTVHDLAWRELPDSVPRARRLYYDLAVPAGLRRAALALAVSDATAAQVARHFPWLAGRVRTTPLGTPTWVWETAPAALPAPTRPFFLCVGTLEPRKNLPRLLDAYADLVAAHGAAAPALRLAGPDGWGQGPLRERLARPDLRGHVTVLGWCDRPTLRAQFALARALLLPSLQEGFGLPALEALACGLPVLAAAGGTPAVLAGSLAVTTDVRDRGALTAALVRLAADDDLAARARREGPARAREWTWERTADLTTAAYGEILGGGGARK